MTTQRHIWRWHLWQAAGPRLPVLAGVLLAAGLSLAGCSSGKNMIEDNNPFFLQGLRLRQENKYDEAAQAFEKCLRFSPSASKAELQLAMLYEDHLADPVKAIEHYRAYLVKVPQGENSDTVRKWLARIERTYLQQLMDRYPEDVDILMGQNLSPAQNATWTPRERALYQQVKRLNGEVMALRQALAKATAVAKSTPDPIPVPPAGATAPPRTPPRTPAGTPPPLETPRSAVETPGSTETGGPAIPPEPVPTTGDMTAGAAPAGTSPDLVEPPTRDFVPVRRLTPGAVPLAPAVATGTPAAASSSARATDGTGTPAPAPAGAAVVATATSGKTYTVLAGDTLSSISRKVYGNVKFWAVLRDANRELLRGGTQVRAGTQLRVPPRPRT